MRATRGRGHEKQRNGEEVALWEAFYTNSSRPSHSKKRADVEALATLAVALATVTLPPHRDDHRRRIGGVEEGGLPQC